MNKLTTVDQGTPFSALQLPELAAALIERVRRERPYFHDLPLITPEERATMPAAIDTLKRGLEGASEDDVLSVLAVVSCALPKRQSEEDTERMFTVYAKTLADIPPDILERAGIEAVKTLKFFPKVAELRELAMRELGRRKYALWLLEFLARKHDHEYRDPIDDPLVDAAKLAKLRGRIGKRFPTRRAITV